MEEKMASVEAELKATVQRVERVEDRQDKLEDLVSAVKILAHREERVEKDVNEIKGDVKSLASRSGKLWDGMVEKAISVIVAALVGYFLARNGII